MASSAAGTVTEYLESLPPERRETISRVRDMVLRNLPEGYEETMNWGMISYEIPLSRYGSTYNRQPLAYVALAVQKNYYALYLMDAYGDSEDARWLREEFARAGKKMDMGKSCLRFRRLDDIPLDVLGEFIGRTTPEDYISRYEATRGRR